MSKTQRRPYPSDDLARIAIDRDLHRALSEAAAELGITGPGVMVRQILSGIETAEDVKRLYRDSLAQRA